MMTPSIDEYGYIHASQPHRPSAVTWGDPGLPGYREGHPVRSTRLPRTSAPSSPTSPRRVTRSDPAGEYGRIHASEPCLCVEFCLLSDRTSLPFTGQNYACLRVYSMTSDCEYEGSSWCLARLVCR